MYYMGHIYLDYTICTIWGHIYLAYIPGLHHMYYMGHIYTWITPYVLYGAYIPGIYTWITPYVLYGAYIPGLHHMPPLKCAAVQMMCNKNYIVSLIAWSEGDCSILCLDVRVRYKKDRNVFVNDESLNFTSAICVSSPTL